MYKTSTRAELLTELSNFHQLACCEKSGYYPEGSKPFSTSGMVSLDVTANLLLFPFIFKFRSVTERPRITGIFVFKFPTQ